MKQYCLRQCEQEKYARKEASIQPSLKILSETKRRIKKVVYNNMILSSVHSNNTVYWRTRMLLKFIKENESIYILVRKYSKKEAVFMEPCNSADLNIYKIDQL